MQVVSDLMPIFLGLISVIMGLIGWVVRDAMKRIDSLMLQANSHETRIAVLSSDSTIDERVDDHELRLRTLEAGIGEIRSDIKVIRNLLEGKHGHGR